MKRNVLIILILSAILWLSGCMMGPNFQKPVVYSPETFRFDSIPVDSATNMGWWELFQDETLIALIDTAINNNKNILIAAERIKEARAALGFTKADMYPAIGYDGSGMRMQGSKEGGQYQGGTGNDFFASTALNWEIDFWGKYRRANEAARAELLATEYAQRNILVNLIADVAATYFQLLDYDARLQISISTRESRLYSLDIIEARFDKGIVPEIDLNQAEIQEAVAASSIPYYQRLVAQTENILSILIGANPQEIIGRKTLLDQPTPPHIPVGIPSEIIQRRPDILEAEAVLAAQTARIGVAQAMRFPSISLTGMLGVGSNELASLATGDAAIWSISGSILGPIFQFGKNKRRVEIEKFRTDQALFSYEQSVISAFAEVEDALIGVNTYHAELDARIRQMEAAVSAEKLSRARYDGGVTSYLEVLESERSLFNAELVTAQTRGLHLMSYVYLYKALGGGWLETRD